MATFFVCDLCGFELSMSEFHSSDYAFSYCKACARPKEPEMNPEDEFLPGDDYVPPCNFADDPEDDEDDEDTGDLVPA